MQELSYGARAPSDAGSTSCHVLLSIQLKINYLNILFLSFAGPLGTRTLLCSPPLSLYLSISLPLILQPLEFLIFVDLSTHQFILPLTIHFCFLSPTLSFTLPLILSFHSYFRYLSLSLLTHSLSLSFTLKLCPLFCRLSQMEKKLRLSRINRPRRA